MLKFAIGQVIVLMLLIGVCQADVNLTEFIEFIGEPELISNAGEIDYNKNQWKPNENWERNGYIKAWIDIPGYAGLINYDGVDYINIPHTDAAFVLHGDKHALTGKYKYDSLSSRISNISYDGNVSIELDTTLNYYYMKIKRNQTTGKIISSKRIDKTQSKQFTYSDTSPPDRYPTIFENANISVVVFNNSLSPKSIINLPEINYTLGYRLEFDGESIEYYYRIISVEPKNNDFPVGNVVNFDSNPIYTNSEIFSRVNNNIILKTGDMDQINESLNLFVITPYEEYKINYTVVNGSTTTAKMDSATMSSILSISILCWIIIYMLKYMRIK